MTLTADFILINMNGEQVEIWPVVSGVYTVTAYVGYFHDGGQSKQFHAFAAALWYLVFLSVIN